MFREAWEPNELAARIFLGMVLYGVALAGLRLVCFMWDKSRKFITGLARKKKNDELGVRGDGAGQPNGPERRLQ